MKAKTLLRSIGIGIIAAALAFAAFGFILENVEKDKPKVAEKQTEAPKESAAPNQNKETESPVTETPGETAPGETKDPAENVPGSEDEVKYTLQVEDGMSAWDVAKLLKDNGIIRDAEEFNEVIKTRGADEAINPGTYDFTNNDTYDQIIRDLTGNTK